MKTLCISLTIIGAFISLISAADFIQNSNCGLTNPAFIERFDQAYPGGKGGDLDETKWSVSRGANEVDNGNKIVGYLQADLPACKQGLPAVAFPDSDIWVCDNTIPGYSGRLMVANAGQNYGLTAFRANQPFDFTGRTGTIAFDLDAFTCTSNEWGSVTISEGPSPMPLYYQWEHAAPPQNAVLVELLSNSIGQIHIVRNFRDETVISTTKYVQLQKGSLNHFEVRISQNRVELWGSDYSTDGVNFPNFSMLGSADNINLSFTKGYVTLGVNNHATIKYSCPRTAFHYWDNLGFDGPALPVDRVYSVPESRTLYSATEMNLGYILYNTNGSRQQGMYTCCGAGTGMVASFLLPGVDLANASSAKLSLSAWYCTAFSDIADPATSKFIFRFNGGAWRDRILTADEVWASKNGGASVPHIITVQLSDLKQGDNTLEINTVNHSLGYPTVIANIDLSVSVSGGATISKADIRLPRENATVLCSTNPFNQTVSFKMNSPVQQRITLDLYSVAGRHILNLAEEKAVHAGVTDLIWNGNDAAGRPTGAGVYCAILKNGSQRIENRIMKSW